jgi:hypothetical protein
MILIAVAGPLVAAFAWYLSLNIRGLAHLRRRDVPIVAARRAYEPPMADKPLDTAARALIRELHTATPTT